MSRPLLSWPFCAATLWFACTACPASADVLEVGRDGQFAVRASDKGATGETGLMRDDRALSADAAPDVPVALLTTIDPPAVPLAYQASLAQAAQAARLSPTLLAALVWQESRWHAAALSPKGARGLTQLMPGTARALAIDPGDAAASLVGGARYLRTMLDMFDGNVERALAAYNAGPGRVMKAGGIPAITETRSYVSAIIDRLAAGAPAFSGGSTR